MISKHILTTSRPVLTKHPDFVSTGLLAARIRIGVCMHRVSRPRDCPQSMYPIVFEHPDFASAYIDLEMTFKRAPICT